MSGSPDPVAQVDAYVASLMEALGSRDALETLAATPRALADAAAGLTPAQAGTPEASGKWSVRQVVQHLADSELVSGFRYRMVLAQDAPLLPGYDQDLWAIRLGYADSDIPTVLVDFTRLRESNLRLLVRATTSDFERVMRHAERGDEPLAKVIRMHAGHDLVHLRQIARIRRAVGA